MKIADLLLQPESKTLEFKRDLSSLTPILKTAVAFANTAGGVLIVGRASDGTLLGVDDIFDAEEKLANAIADNIRPHIMPEVEIATVNGKNLLILQVSHWRGPFYLKRQGTPAGIYVRLGSTSRPAGPELIAEMQRTVLNVSFDQKPVSELTLKSLDMDKVGRAFDDPQKSISRQKLLTLGLTVKSANRTVPSIGGLILFGKEAERQQFVPDARVSCALFHGKEKSNILDRHDMNGSIVDAIDSVPIFISRNTRLAAKIEQVRRKDIFAYHPVAVREALINALAHADYSLIGSRIQIAIFSDRLEIQNPGMLPFGFTMEDLKAGISRIRNRVIAKVFREMKLMEEWGSGYKRIIEACRIGGYPEPEWEEFGSAIRVTFYPHPATRGLQPKKEEEESPDLTMRQQDVMDLFKQSKTLPFRDIFAYFKKTVSERTLRYDLSRLKEVGFLKVGGKGPARIWKKV